VSQDAINKIEYEKTCVVEDYARQAAPRVEAETTLRSGFLRSAAEPPSDPALVRGGTRRRCASTTWCRSAAPTPDRSRGSWATTCARCPTASRENCA
jgi:hypothetical protein